jgi:hypothetical protein
MRDEHGLTIKQRRFADEVISGQPAAQAVLAAGYQPTSDNNRYVQAYRLANHPSIRQYVLESIEAAGVTPLTIATRINQLMHTECAEDVIGGKRISLESAKELNKMIGAYAPSESRALRVSASLQSRDTRELAYLARHGRRPTAAELADKDTDG